MPEHVAMHVHDFATRLLHEVRLLEKAAVVVVRHEADFHALLLVGGLELQCRATSRVSLLVFSPSGNIARAS
jgi:hypothetical protein